MFKITEAEILDIIVRTYNVKSFRIRPKDFINYKAGQFMHVILKDSPEFMRYLSISSSPTEEGYLEFTKKLTDSEFSKALNQLKVTDKIKIKYPFGNFVLKDTDTKIAFLSGGIGITPIRSICKFVSDKGLNLDIVLIYANRTFKDIVFREDLELMQKENKNLKVVYVLSEPAEEIRAKLGLINEEIIKEEIADFKERRFYLCGPPAMVGAMKDLLKNKLDLEDTQIVTEKFQGY